MDIFNKKKIEQLEVLTKSLQEEVEKKGYFGVEEQNKFLKAFYNYLPNVSLIDFSTTDFTSYINYYKTNAIVYGLVGTTISKAVGELSEYIELINEKEEVIKKHWALDVLNQPNDLENKRSFIVAWSILRMLTGNSFISIEKTLGSKREVKELYNIPANQIDIVTGGAAKPIAGFKLKVEAGMKATFLPEEVIFSREYNPDITSLYGLSPLQAAANYVQIIDKAMKRQNTALENGGVSRVITPVQNEYGTTPQDVDKLEKEMNKKHSGNYTKALTIPIDVHEISDTPADLSILESSKFAINALCFVYGVSVDSFLGQAKYENAREAKKAIYQQAAIPLVNLYLEDLMKGFGRVDESFKSGKLKFILNTDKVEILKNSTIDMINAYAQANASINDKRDLLGLPKIDKPYADEPIVPLGVTFGDPANLDINENNTTI